MKPRAIAAIVLALSVLCAPAADLEAYSRTAVSLISPKQLATLGKRGANPRLQKAVAWLHEGKVEGLEPGSVLDDAPRRVEMTGIHGGRTSISL